MKECPVGKLRTLEKHEMSADGGTAWSCTNPDCSAYQQLENYDLDDEDD